MSNIFSNILATYLISDKQTAHYTPKIQLLNLNEIASLEAIEKKFIVIIADAWL